MRADRLVHVVVIGVAAVALSSCGTTSPGGVVPWAALSASPTTTTVPSTTTLPDAPACRASQFRARVGRGGVGLGNDLTTIVLTNTGPLCRLSGYPNLEGLSATQGWRPLQVRKTGTYFGDLNAANVATGRSGLLLLGTSVSCNALNSPSEAQILANERAFTYHAIRVVFANRRGTVGVNHLDLDVACGLEESHLGVWPPTSGVTVAPPGSVGVLLATVTLPRSLRAGTTMHYVVTLRNPTKTAVHFTPCPNFTEFIFLAPDVNGTRPEAHTYALNCAQATPVSPHDTERFAMELTIPYSARSSLAKFGWSLDTDVGPFAGRAITVLPARTTSP